MDIIKPTCVKECETKLKDFHRNAKLHAEIQKLQSQLAEAERARVELLDKVNGTPCAEIRWMQEKEDLTNARDEALVKLAVTREEMGIQKSIVNELCVLLGVKINDGYSALCVSAAEEALSALKRRVGVKAISMFVKSERDKECSPFMSRLCVNADDYIKRIESGEAEL